MSALTGGTIPSASDLDSAKAALQRANLDSARSHEIMQLLRSFNREQGITIVMVTHESDMAAYAGRTIRFRDGLAERLDLQKGAA